MNVGLLSIGISLPPNVRNNDYWNEDAVREWAQRTSGRFEKQQENKESLDESALIIQKHMAKVHDDPFRGARTRHVMPEGMRTTDMEVAAAKEAIDRGHIDVSEIDLLLSSTTLPNNLLVPNAPTLHRQLGLKNGVLSIQTESVCNGFLQQLPIAIDMLRSGRAKKALLIQSSGWSKFAKVDEPHSAWLGDGAAAVVLGPVEENLGVVGDAHETIGLYDEGLVLSVPGHNWWNGPVEVFVKDLAMARRMVLDVGPSARRILDQALSRAGLQKSDVSFFACHQGTRWVRAAMQEVLGLSHARSFDTFELAGSISGANIPLVLSQSERQGLLSKGDVVVAFSAGVGSTHSCAVFRWAF